MAKGRLHGWPLVLSVAGHGVAIAALVLFARARWVAKKRSPLVALATPTVESEESASVVREEEPRSDVVDSAPAPRPVVPLAAPVDPADDAPDVLPPLPDRPEDADVPWIRIDVPPSVVERRLRVGRRASAPAHARTPPPERREEKAPLVPLVTPQYYPREALRRGLEGRVRVEIVIHTSGAVIGARVVTSSGFPLLDEAAVASARQWRFAPIAHARRVVIPFRFQRDR